MSKKTTGLYNYRFPDWLAERVRARATPDDLRLEDAQSIPDEASIRRRMIKAGAEAIAAGTAPKVDTKIFGDVGRPKLTRFEIEGAKLGMYRSEKSGTISITVEDIEQIDWAEVVELYGGLQQKKGLQTAIISFCGKQAPVAELLESIRQGREDDSSLIRRALFTGLILEEEAAGITHEPATPTKKSPKKAKRLSASRS